MYQNGTADDPLLKLAQPSGLLTDSINVPEVYAQQIGSSQQVKLVSTQQCGWKMLKRFVIICWGPQEP